MSPPFTSPAAAEEAFYRAFAALDATAMRRVWSTNQPVSCIHPGGPFLQGLDAVLESWAEIFARSSVVSARRLQASHNSNPSSPSPDFNAMPTRSEALFFDSSRPMIEG